MLKHPVPDEMLKQIGDMTVSYSLLESNLKLLIWSLIGAPQHIARTVTADMRMLDIRNLAMRLYIERNGKDEGFEILDQLIKQAETISKGRNRIVHSIWAVGPNESSARLVKVSRSSKSGFQLDWKTETEDSLKQLVSNIKKLSQEIQNFYISLIDKGKATNIPP